MKHVVHKAGYLVTRRLEADEHFALSALSHCMSNVLYRLLVTKGNPAFGPRTYFVILYREIAGKSVRVENGKRKTENVPSPQAFRILDSGNLEFGNWN